MLDTAHDGIKLWQHTRNIAEHKSSGGNFVIYYPTATITGQQAADFTQMLEDAKTSIENL